MRIEQMKFGPQAGANMEITSNWRRQKQVVFTPLAAANLLNRRPFCWTDTFQATQYHEAAVSRRDVSASGILLSQFKSITEFDLVPTDTAEDKPGAEDLQPCPALQMRHRDTFYYLLSARGIRKC